MPPRTKSFFEGNTKNTRPNNWYHDYPTRYLPPIEKHGPVETKEHSVNAIPASTQAKLKLKAFAYADTKSMEVAQTTRQTYNDKENRGAFAGQRETVQGGFERQPTEGLKDQSRPNRCPQTPLTRIPLKDLIGDSINNRQEQDEQFEQEEKVSWSNSPCNMDIFSPLVAPPSSARRSAQKRMRSSSPASSQNDTVDFISQIQHPLKTPKNNRAAELLKRFTEDSIERSESPSRVTPSFFSARGLSPPPSPTTDLCTRNSSGLRRAVSCGNVWPRSKAKRRRLNNQNDSDLLSPLEDATTDPGTDRTKVSRLSLLVEKVEESLTESQSPDTQVRFSSSSPFPKCSSVYDRLPGSPLASVAAVARLGHPKQSKRGATVDSDGNLQAIGVDHSPGNDSEAEDFGGDDLDLDLLVATEHFDVSHNQLDTDGLIEATNEYTAVSSSVQHQATETDPPASKASTRRVLSRTKSENFGDDDEDFATDWENLAAQYDEDPPQSCESETRAVKSDVSKTNVGVEKVGCKRKRPSDFDDFADDLDDDDFAQLEQSLQTAEGSISSRCESQAIKRYRIESVADGDFQSPQGQLYPEKVLMVKDEGTSLRKAVMLRQSWYNTACYTGAYVNIIGDFDFHGHCVVDDNHNLLILHPDQLISTTTVADAFNCPRRAVLQSRVRATSEATPPLVYGQMLHETFQEAMQANSWDIPSLNNIIKALIPRHLEKLHEIHVGVQGALEYLSARMPDLRAWAIMYVGARPKAGALIRDRNETINVSISKLLDVEEHIWSPMYGLKGNIDATVQAVFREDGKEKTLAVPFELKSGKNENIAHRAQTALYTLLLSDRYDIDVVHGILYYMEKAEIYRVAAVRRDIMHMIIRRNELAAYQNNPTELPPMLQNPHLCGRCYASSACFIYHKLTEDGNEKTSGIQGKFDDEVGHLKESDREFFRKWEDLLTKEESCLFKFRRELWTMSSVDRERVGRCFAEVVIEPGSEHEDKAWQKMYRFRFTFRKKHPTRGFSFTESEITVGEPIVISDEKGHYAFANGYVTEIRPKRITVAVDRHLRSIWSKQAGFHRVHNQVFSAKLGPNVRSEEEDKEEQEEIVYRLDKDEFSGGMATIRNNLISMMEKSRFRSKELRKLIIEGAPPAFKLSSTLQNLIPSASQAALNGDQKNAIKQVMGAKDYALVLGMPGTGKTTTIAHIIRTLVSQNKSVLLTSYTHNAVDNILLKLRNDGIRILRIGAVTKIHPEVRKFADLAAQQKRTMEELADSYENSKIVATTCLGVNHPIFNERIFDYCIVDEASQITLPVCLGPIRMAKTFILVGDHNQLPPLVQNKQAREGGLDVSLFRLLSEKQPCAVVNLEHQYRMCEEIMLLSNTLIYNGRLKCGNEEIAKRSLVVPHMDQLKQLHQNPLTQSTERKRICLAPVRGSCWLCDIVDPCTKACFINTDPLLPESRETANGSRIVNHAEAQLCAQIVEGLLIAGVAGADIGVVTLYRSQLALIKREMRHDNHGVELHTADRFQGRDKEVIILSLVRSNDQKNVGDLLKDWRRVNVALTRARTKLLVIGSKETLSSDQLMCRFLQLMGKKHWIYELPIGALNDHAFERLLSTQSLSSTVIPKKTEPAGEHTSPASAKKRKKTTPLSPSRGANKKARKVGIMDMDKLLNSKPVIQDILHDVVY